MAEIRKNKMSNNTTSNQTPTPQPEQPDNEETRKRRFFFDEEEPTNVESTALFDEFNPTTPVVERGKQPPAKRRRITRCTSPEEYIERYNGKMVDLLLKLTQSKLPEVPGWLTPIEGTKVWK